MADKMYTVQELLELAHKFKAVHIKCGPLEVQVSESAFSQSGQLGSGELGPFSKMPTAEEFQFAAGLSRADEGEEN